MLLHYSMLKSKPSLPRELDEFEELSNDGVTHSKENFGFAFGFA